MGRFSKETTLLFFLFAIVLATRLTFVFQTTTLDSDSYFVLRQAEHIKETGLPLFKDDLSYSGRTYIFPPLFHYLVALGSFFLPTIMAAKVISSICLAALVFVSYAISKQITKNKNVALIAALFTGFVPGMYMGLDSATPTTLSILLVFLTMYCFLRLDETGFSNLSVFLAILSILTSTEIFFMIFGIFIYFTILFLEREKSSNREKEFVIFLFYLSIWFVILVYKKSLLYSGLPTIWGNLPQELITSYFQEIGFVKLIYYAGVIPLLLGVYAIYSVVFDTKNRFILVFTGISISYFFALWFRLLPLNSSIIFFTMSIIILSSHGLKAGIIALSKMKSKTMPVISAIIIIFLFITTTVPYFFSISTPEPQLKEDIAALAWLRENSPKDSVVLGRVDEGFLINYYSERKNVADKNFLFIRDSQKTYSDIERLYQLRLLSEGVRILNNYDVNYIFLSKKTKESLNMSELYFAESDCLNKVYDDSATIYLFKGCTI